MNFVIIMAGIIATLSMTLFVELTALVSRKPFHVIRILANMLRFDKDFNRKQKRMIFIVATILHYGIGVGFAYCYDLSLESDLLTASWKDALLFGAGAGTVGIIVWRIFFAIHPNPPKINLVQYLAVIWLGHLVFACGLFLHVKNYIGIIS